MKKLATLELDLYEIYDRMFEGIIINVDIQYDFDAICKDKGLNKNNAKYIKCDVRQNEFLKNNLIYNLTAIEKDVEDYFKDNIIFEDAIVEQLLTDSEYNRWAKEAL